MGLHGSKRTKGPGWFAAAAFAGAFLFGLAAPMRSSAHEVDRIGIGARAISLGGAYTALATGWNAAYYNPAGVGLRRQAVLSGGFQRTEPSLRFRSGSSDPTLDDRVGSLPSETALTGGIAAPLGRRGSLLGRFGLGFLIYLPLRHTLTLDWRTAPAEPGFFFYGNRQTRIMLLPAVAFRVPLGALEDTQSLAIGVAMNTLVNVNGEQTFDLSGTAGSTMTTRARANYATALHASVLYVPRPWLSFGMTFRDEMSFGTDLDVQIDISGNGQADVPLRLQAVSFFQPRQVAVGIALDPTERATLSLDLVWENWSAFDDPFLTVEGVAGQIAPGFHDTWSPRFGLEVEVVSGFDARLGYAYRPSPAPTQSGETTTLAPSEHVVSVGAGYTWWSDPEPDPALDEAGAPGDDETAEARSQTPLFTIDAFVSWHHLASERVTKAAAGGSTVVGAGYSASGDVISFGLTLTLPL